MDFALFQRITEEMRTAGVDEIGVFYLGESFMAPHLLIDCIKWVKKLGFPYVFLTSNASLARPEFVESCMKAGLNSLKWSVNASDPEQYKTLMQVSPKYFHKSLENIKAAWEVRERGGYKCGLYASSIQYDGEQAERMQALLNEHVNPYVDEHYFLPLFGQMTQQTEERSRELGFVPTAGNQGRVGALREPLPCWAVFTEGHVTAKGILSACCFDADGRFGMGDLTRHSFADAWNSPEFQALRSAHLRKDVKGTVCEGCMAYG
jgi:MoaA/NifB/PqqE/SkfB family radical SAM enzyme